MFGFKWPGCEGSCYCVFSLDMETETEIFTLVDMTALPPKGNKIVR